MRYTTPELPHSLATFRFVISLFVVGIIAVSLGQWWTYETIQSERSRARAELNNTICDILRVFTGQNPRTDLTPEQMERRRQVYAQVNARLECNPPLP